MVMLVQSYRKASSGGDGVQPWVDANSSKVIGYYKCDDAGNNTTLADSSSNSRDGAWDATASNTTASLDDGSTGADVSTSGDTDLGGAEVDTSHGSAFDACDGAFGVFHHDDDNTRVQCYFSRDDLDTRRAWQVRRVSGFLQLRINGTTNVVSVSAATAGVTASDNEFTLGWTKVGTTYSVYVDGSSVGSGTGPSSLNSFTGQAGSIARYLSDPAENPFPFNGVLGEVVFLDGATTTDLVDLHDEYASGL